VTDGTKRKIVQRENEKNVKWQDVSLYEGSASRTSTSLLQRAQTNESDAWQLLVNTYSRRVYRWCRRAGLQSADSANVVQEVLRAVARKLPEFRRDQAGDTFRGWLWRITQNKLHDFYRVQRRQADRAAGGTDAHRRILQVQAPDWPATSMSMSNSGVGTTNPSYQPLSAWGQRLVAQVRAEFSERDWRFFWRIVVDGQSAVEVGEEFGVTANAVRLVKMRILRRLREAVTEGPSVDDRSAK
jgi:RNA polymerase sigma-70 factor (ECF subfamily)